MTQRMVLALAGAARLRGKGGRSNQLRGATGLRRKLEALEYVARDGLAQGEQLVAVVDKLDKQLARAGKEQFKANTLAATVQSTLRTGLEQLREVESRRENDIAKLRQQLTDSTKDGRLSVLKALLPALDGMAHVLAASAKLTGTTPARPGFGQRMCNAWTALFGREAISPIPAWAKGVRLVEERLLSLLAEEGIRPLITENKPFDPALHVAAEVVEASAAHPQGTVAQELRRGYSLRGELLRYAEVAVAQKAAAPVIKK